MPELVVPSVGRGPRNMLAEGGHFSLVDCNKHKPLSTTRLCKQTVRAGSCMLQCYVGLYKREKERD